MPVRDLFPRAYFDENPYEGLDPHEIYERLQWGNKPRETYEIDAPEALVALGTLALLKSEGGEAQFDEDYAPFLAVGAESNRLYIVPIGDDGGPIDVPSGPYVEVCPLVQTDYLSEKGGESAYYFHEHEAPFPTLFIHEETGAMIIEAVVDEDGTRSYAVGDEGVIG